MQEIQVSSLGQKDPLEKERATHFSILAWKIPWTEEPRITLSDTAEQVMNEWMCYMSRKWFLMTD